MDELLDWSAEDYREVDEWLYQGNLSPKRLTKTMIRLLDRELSWQGEADSQSLRGLWYSGVKTAYQNAFPRKWDDPNFDANRRYAQYLSETLSEMVKEGEVTYRGLNIVDDSRQREVMADTIEDDKILFVEKEAAFRRLKPLSDVFELSLVSGGGWEATALIEDMSHRLVDDQEYHLFVMTDYDPTGYSIADDFERRARQLGANITEVERVAIEPDQVSEEVRTQERFKVPVETDSDERWLERHGIDGEYGLEIEAIGGRGEGGRPLREIVVNALDDHLRKRRHREEGKNVATANTAAGGAQRLVSDITDDLEDALVEYAVERLSEEDAVNRIYVSDVGQVRASTDLDESGEMVPDAHDWDVYREAALEGRERPYPYSNSRRMQDWLQEQIEAGEIDVEDLLDL